MVVRATANDSSRRFGEISIKGISEIIPVFLYSVVENNSPSNLEINYDQNLSNISPPNEAFTVNINSHKIKILEVSISGSKVVLRLERPIVYGEFVTFDYSKPEINSLQSMLGGQASSLSPQNVTNKLSNESAASQSSDNNSAPVIS